MKCKDNIPVTIFKKYQGVPALGSIHCPCCDAIMPAFKTKDGWFFIHPSPNQPLNSDGKKPPQVS